MVNGTLRDGGDQQHAHGREGRTLIAPRGGMGNQRDSGDKEDCWWPPRGGGSGQGDTEEERNDPSILGEGTAASGADYF